MDITVGKGRPVSLEPRLEADRLWGQGLIVTKYVRKNEIPKVLKDQTNSYPKVDLVGESELCSGFGDDCRWWLARGDLKEEFVCKQSLKIGQFATSSAVGLVISHFSPYRITIGDVKGVLPHSWAVFASFGNLSFRARFR